VEHRQWEEGTIGASSCRLGADEGRIGGADGDKTRRRQTPQTASGYTIMCSKAVSGHQGGVALAWKEDDPKIEVESVLFNNGPNIVTFQVTTGDDRFYVIGTYAPPDCRNGVDNLRRAWEACPQGCRPIVLGDLNINFWYPRDEREEIIVDLLDEINLIDSLRSFRLRTPQQAGTQARWTWSQRRQGTRYYTQLTSWLVRGTSPDLRAWDSDPRGFSTRIIAQSLRIFGWEGRGSSGITGARARNSRYPSLSDRRTLTQPPSTH
jgi:hypothetical protein